jgi:hypothetical protein
MTLSREALVNALALLIVAAAGAWVVHKTEWVDETVPIPPQGEAARDRHYVVKQLVRRLGGEVVAPQHLGTFPPAHATLVLSSWHGDLFPERELALRRWVEAGGRLVVQDAARQPDWIPISEKRLPRAAGAASAPPLPKPPPRAMLPRSLPRPIDCHELNEPEGMAPAFKTPRPYRLCGGGTRFVLQTHAPVSWALHGPDGPEIVRVGVGRGSVTMSSADISDNHDILEGDNALIFMATLQLRPGQTVWFVDTERRPPLLALIWNTGAPAVLLGALALAFAWWRAGVRFGPRAPTPVLARRSVAEQIRGTASFIFQRDSAVLHRAQLRALEQAARRRVRDHDRLDRRSRAEAIAKATALDPKDLARAMDPKLRRTRRELLVTLELLETAVRRLSRRSEAPMQLRSAGDSMAHLRCATSQAPRSGAPLNH